MNEYKYREGYSKGFGTGLTGRENEYELNEKDWKPEEKTAHKAEEDYDDLTSDMYNNVMMADSLDKFMVGFNWGYYHGSEIRGVLKSQIPPDEFENRMQEFAETLNILYLNINKERYLHGVWDLKPEEEKKGRLNFIGQFLDSPVENKESEEKLKEIRELISADKLLRAINASIVCFKEKKDISAYLKALSLRVALDDLRQGNKSDKLDSSVYKSEMKKIMSELAKLIPPA